MRKPPLIKSHRAIERRLDAAAQACLDEGAELTPLRRTVLALVLEAERPLTAYQLLDRLAKTRKGAMPPTIYRTLEFLIERKLVHKLERLNAFVPCIEPGDHSHPVEFLICQACGSVSEVEDEAVSAALRDVAERHAFRPLKAVVEVEGTCADCARQQRHGAG